MASITEVPPQRYVDPETVKDRTTFLRYESNLQCAEKVERVALVVGAAGMGAIGGAIGGAFIPPPGAWSAPAAGIGAAVAGISTAIAITKLDYDNYKAYRKQLSDEAVKALDQKLYYLTDSKDTVCPITHSVPLTPARIKGEMQIYERAALMQWVKAHGTSPYTRQQCTEQNVQFAIDGVPAAVAICEEALCDPYKSVMFTKRELDGIRIFRKELKQNAEKTFLKELKRLTKLFEKKPTAENFEKLQTLQQIMKPAFCNDKEL